MREPGDKRSPKRHRSPRGRLESESGFTGSRDSLIIDQRARASLKKEKECKPFKESEKEISECESIPDDGPLPETGTALLSSKDATSARQSRRGQGSQSRGKSTPVGSEAAPLEESEPTSSLTKLATPKVESSTPKVGATSEGTRLGSSKAGSEQQSDPPKPERSERRSSRSQLLRYKELL